uniref:Uncharacterized protein n=1 Tax=Attheya septentrionalis TaxID=420275 RepID=A0A6T7IZY0_9STRA|mmetsp:Transcript_26997/g.49107  ORF Transcript_26997/g.49107 Transcript_26997/m.49107 type:complete len:459 (+) Transcript_26997:210-1586(+)
MMSRWTAPLPLLLWLVFSLNVLCDAERDGNAPWGDKKPPRGFEMWWRDPANVLEDLSLFSSLYISVSKNTCIWSEYGIDNFDDDGEGRDGDEEWYMGRTQPYRANVAYDLYGVLKGQLRLNKCSRSTYINTFVTNMGADTIFNLLKKTNQGNTGSMTAATSSQGDGNAYCGIGEDSTTNDADQEYDENENQNGDGRRRKLEDGHEDYGDDDNSVSSTMGCSSKGSFVKASFQGSYCNGNYFLWETDKMSSYNHAMSRIGCTKVYGNGRSGDTLLSMSSACDGFSHQGRCPDPYGLKKRYARMSGLGSKNWEPIHKFVRTVSWIGFVCGISLMGLSRFLRRKYGPRPKKRSSRSRKDKERGSKKKRSSKSKSKSSKRVSKSRSQADEESIEHVRSNTTFDTTQTDDDDYNTNPDYTPSLDENDTWEDEGGEPPVIRQIMSVKSDDKSCKTSKSSKTVLV